MAKGMINGAESGKDVQVVVVIIEDDAHISEKIGKIVSEDGNAVVRAVASTCEDGIKAILAHRPHVIFLDILLEDGNAFEMLRRVGVIRSQLIFITSYEQHAIEAIKHDACDYVLKPFSRSDVENALSKAIERCKIENANKEQWPQSPLKRILLHDHRGMQMVELSDILRCSADGNYTEFHLKAGRKLVVTGLMREFEELLEPNGFCRVSRSTILNLHHVSRLINCGALTVVMADGHETEVAKSRKGHLMASLYRIGTIMPQ